MSDEYNYNNGTQIHQAKNDQLVSRGRVRYKLEIHIMLENDASNFCFAKKHDEIG